MRVWRGSIPHVQTCRVGYSVKKKLQSIDTYKVSGVCVCLNGVVRVTGWGHLLQDRASQIAAVEATFESAKQPVCEQLPSSSRPPKLTSCSHPSLHNRSESTTASQEGEPPIPPLRHAFTF